MIRWLEKTDSDDLYLSVITIGEVKKGINKLPASKKKQDLLFWLETLLEDYQSRILPVDLAVMENWSLLVANAEKKGQPIASMDSIIGAVAYTHHLTLVTRNERDFYACTIPMINPWQL
ncbi:PIN domain-containing protein [Methylovulum psychrotolerans]|uniref:PIN domain-containing protein n=1 Tax=Methylovulum psychrotolerans TaxID=1704499 RepID=A0A2S5CPE5_9GAMM|nr:PIN domain-containing protein [Methylovulum psychrotolerans]